MGINVFFDANVLLQFYSYGKDTLKELEKIHEKISRGSIALYLTEHVVSEFNRGRLHQIGAALDAIEKNKIDKNYPTVVRESSHFTELQSATKSYEDAAKEISSEIRQQAEKFELPADVLIKQLIKDAVKLECGDDVLEAASKRHKRGNPPGKLKQNLGDQIHWESLLRFFDKANLILITRDGDFCSPLESNNINPILADEWTYFKDGEIKLYRNLQDFLKDKLPDIELNEQLEYEDEVDRLVNSRSFSETHAAIGTISAKYDLKSLPYSDSQIRALLEAAETNSQIAWIYGDEDVNLFFETIKETNPSLRQEMEEGPPPDEDIPF